MKRILITLAVVALFGLSSCEKGGAGLPEPTFCFECTTTASSGGYSATEKQTYCGITVKKSKEIEKAGTGNFSGVPVRTTCKKK